MQLLEGVTFYSLLLTSFALLLFCLFLLLTNKRRDNDDVNKLQLEETYYHNPKTQQKEKFPAAFEAYENLSDPVILSVIAPAYNEEKRLQPFMEETLKYLKQRATTSHHFTYEMILVDDGSKDNTSSKALEYVEKEGTHTLRLLKLTKNRGKGGAVRRGMMVARGKYLLMADSDGATKFSDLEKLEAHLKKIEKDGFGVVVGSRYHLQQEAVAKRTILRNLLMWGFHFLVEFLCVKGIHDTQCGFKLFSRKAATTLFSNLHIERWAFDVELLYLAQRFGIPVAEVAVNWKEIDGSHLSPFASSVQMGKDLLRIRLSYLLGLWKAKKVE